MIYEEGWCSSSLNRFAGYWQICLRGHVQKPTASKCKYQSFQFLVMPFGLLNASATFQPIANNLFGGMDLVRAYIDDIAVLSKTLDVHIEHITVVRDRMDLTHKT